MQEVVHVNYSDYDVYIGRGLCPKTGKKSIWFNPFTHIKNKKTLAEFTVSSREEALEKYREYLLNNDELMARIIELDGKILGCWCIKNNLNYNFFPYVCHGQIIKEVINQIKFKKTFIV